MTKPLGLDTYIKKLIGTKSGDNVLQDIYGLTEELDASIMSDDVESEDDLEKNIRQALKSTVEIINGRVGGLKYAKYRLGTYLVALGLVLIQRESEEQNAN